MITFHQDHFNQTTCETDVNDCVNNDKNSCSHLVGPLKIVTPVESLCKIGMVFLYLSVAILNRSVLVFFCFFVNAVNCEVQTS